jgi:hypothetical protein
MNRVCIYTKDIQVITGKSERQCRYIISAIKKKHAKEKHQMVTLEEFCDYMGIKEEGLQQYLK